MKNLTLTILSLILLISASPPSLFLISVSPSFCVYHSGCFSIGFHLLSFPPHLSPSPHFLTILNYSTPSFVTPPPSLCLLFSPCPLSLCFVNVMNSFRSDYRSEYHYTTVCDCRLSWTAINRTPFLFSHYPGRYIRTWPHVGSRRFTPDMGRRLRPAFTWWKGHGTQTIDLGVRDTEREIPRSSKLWI